MIGGQDSRALTEGIEAGLFSYLVDMAQQNDVLPSLAVRCEEQQIDSASLDNTRDELLKQELRENTLRNMRISAQAIKLTKQLNAAGITPLFLKGTALLLTENENNLGFRKQIDIDLLVEPSQLEAAAEVFLAGGYGFLESAGSSTSAPTLLIDTKTAMKRSATHHHLTPLAKAGYNAPVELHRHFLPRRFQSKNPLKPLFNAASEQQSHGASFLIPSVEYQMIHLLLGATSKSNISYPRGLRLHQRIRKKDRKYRPGINRTALRQRLRHFCPTHCRANGVRTDGHSQHLL